MITFFKKTFLQMLGHGLLGLGLISLLVYGCAAHIKPKPDFKWPEMAGSVIPSKLAIYIPSKQDNMSVKADPAAECCPHKELLIGKGATALTKEVCLAVFKEAILFDKKPSEDFLKNNGFRGLLTLDSIKVMINMPIKTIKGDSVSISDMSIRMGIDYSAIDFLIKQDSLTAFGPDIQVGKPMKAGDLKKIDKTLEDLANRTLDESGKYLAQALVDIYGARQ
jgi:hypothetical protein